MRPSGVGVRSVLRNAMHLFGSHLATTLGRGIYVVVLARALGPEDFGVFNYGLAWYLLFISLTYLGLDTYLVQRISVDKTSAPQALRQTLFIRTSAAVLIALASCGIAILMDDSPAAWRLNAIFSIALIGRAIWMWAVSAFTAFERTQFSLRWDAVFRPVEIVTTLVVLAWRPDVLWVAVAHAALWCAQGGAGLWTVARQLSPLAGPLPLRGCMRLLARTFPVGVYTIVTIAFIQAPIVIMKLIESDRFKIGQFALAYSACMYFLVIPYLISSVMLPVVSRSSARGDGQDVTLLALLFRATCVLGAAGVVFVGPLIPSLTAVLFGPEYFHSGELLRAGLWLAIPFSAVTFIMPLFFARGAYSPVGLNGVLGVVTMLVAMGPATSIASQIGALLAVGLGMSAWLILMLLIMRPHVPAYDRRRSLRAFATAVATMLAHALTSKLGLWPQMAVSIAVLLAAAVVLRAVDRDDIRALVIATTGIVGGSQQRG